VVDLLDPVRNVIYGMTVEQARGIVARGNPDEVRSIDGHFALVGRDGKTVRLARTIGRLMRYFIAKRAEGPALIIADRMDAIQKRLSEEGLADQFHPSYTRMVPAHHVVELRLLGCPDPNPTYARFFAPPRATLPADLDMIGEHYIEALQHEVTKWLRRVPEEEPVGVCFSGGIDSGSVFLVTYHAMLNLGMNPSRLKAFTLSVDGGGKDVEQARDFLRRLDLDVFLETLEVSRDDVSIETAIEILEDYKPLDLQAGAALLALCRAIHERYPDWKYLLDGDGGDENLKDYPIEENPELTIRSVLNNAMLYQEGWGVQSIKHSLVYSGGQSRGYARTYAPTMSLGFSALSPYVSPSVIQVSEAIPFIELTEWSHDRLYALKGEIVSRGVRRVTGIEMPIFEKRRFQHGALSDPDFAEVFSASERECRRRFHGMYERSAS
jgi:asparagine synthase (glutamine-hydrolysing)